MQQLTSKAKKKQPGLLTKSRSTYGNVVMGNFRGKSPKPSTSQSGKDSQSPMKGGTTSNASSKERKGGCNNRGRLLTYLSILALNDTVATGHIDTWIS